MSAYSKTTPHIVSFIDILGYSELVKNAEVVNRLFEAIESAVNEVKNGISKLDSLIELDAKAFSDNIVISSIYYPDSEDKLCMQANAYSMIENIALVAEIQKKLITEFGFMVRGGITVGEYYASSDFVFGKGLVDAYILEETGSKNLGGCPRVVIDKQLVKDYRRCLEATGEVVTDEEFERVFWTDRDSSIFLNYVYAALVYEGILHLPATDGGKEALKKHHYGTLKAYEHILKSIESVQDDKEKMKLAEKYYWLQNYHNDLCNPHALDLSINKTIEL